MTNNGDMTEIPIDTLAETENYTIWSAVEPDGEMTFHIELGPVTAHFFTEEWGEFLEMIREAIEGEEAGSSDDVEVEMDWGTLYFARDEWNELAQLIGSLQA
ncbi:MAG: hypothetical protein KJ047_13455 [Anaerolineae bacterium]|nr:hypothetical protein [Anaerolineae bacterium]MEB2288438.1 hypothetical protein [Anaerolineae bacterium]